MNDLPDSLEELVRLLDPPTSPVAGRALEAITKIKGRGATTALTDFLAVAPHGLMATRAAMSLETRKHKSCLPAIREIYEARRELAEDLVPILSALEDPEGVPLVVRDLPDLLVSPARLSALAYLVKLLPPTALVDALLPIVAKQTLSAADDDVRWALAQVLTNADERTLEHVAEVAQKAGPRAAELVKPYLPKESEFQRQAPEIARRLIRALESEELIELVPDSAEALVDLLATTILEASSPKGLIKDVERILMETPAIEEIYADREDLRRVFAKVTA